MIRKHPLLAAFTLAYSLGFLAWALRAGNAEFLFYIAIMVVIIILVLWANARARFTTAVLWLLSFWGLFHMAGGNVPVPPEGIGFGTTAPRPDHTTVLYNLWLLPRNILKYDQLIHAYGFYVATHACWQALRRFLSPTATPGLALLVITACAGMGLGAVNEVVEYIATLLGPSNVGDYANNAQDLIFNMTGAATAAAVIAFGLSRGWGRESGNASVLAGLLPVVLASIAVGLALSIATRSSVVAGMLSRPVTSKQVQSGGQIRAIAQAASAWILEHDAETPPTLDAMVQHGWIAPAAAKSPLGPARDGGPDYAVHPGPYPLDARWSTLIPVVDRAAIVNRYPDLNFAESDGDVIFTTTDGVLSELERPENRPLLDALNLTNPN